MKKIFFVLLIMTTTIKTQEYPEYTGISCEQNCDQASQMCQDICETFNIGDCRKPCQAVILDCKKMCSPKSAGQSCKTNQDCASGTCQSFGIPEQPTFGICTQETVELVDTASIMEIKKIECRSGLDCQVGQRCMGGKCITPTITSASAYNS